MEAEALSKGDPQDTGEQVADPWLLAATSLPALVGLGLGAIYALGAVEACSQLVGEDLGVLDFFPLIPLNQILGRGIALALTFVPLTLLFLSITFVTEGFSSSRFRRLGKRVGGQLAIRYTNNSFLFPLLTVGLILYAALFGYLLIAVTPWTSLIAAPLCFLWLRYIGGWLIRRLGRLRGAAAASLSFIVVIAIFSISVMPDRLSNVTLRRSHGSPVHGSLVANTGQEWYVAQGPTVRVIPADTVAEARIEPASPRVSSEPLSDILSSVDP